jgi:hypothetical protein
MIFIWDNGEEFSDHAVWFIESELPRQAVERLLEGAVNPFSRLGGVIAVLEPEGSVRWKQSRLESLESWFTYYGDALVHWRTRAVQEAMADLPKEAVERLAQRLSPGNAAIVRGGMS